MNDEQELVTVYETDLPLQVAMVKLHLGGAGIDYMAVNDIISTVYPVDGMAVVRFQVRAEDAERALQVLHDHGHR